MIRFVFRSRWFLLLSLLLAALTVLPARAQELNAKQLDAVWAELIGNDDEGAKKAVAAVDPKKIHQTIAELDSTNFQAREAAAKSLEALGPVAAPLVEKKLQEKISLEVRQALEGVLQRIDDRDREST